MSTKKIKKMKLDEILPYWNNPRDNDDAVPAVQASLREFGQQKPLILDKEHVIIAGHTTYRALRAEGYTEADVVISDLPEEKARSYRIIDNKTSEKAKWDWEKLVPELRTIEDLDQWIEDFPELELPDLQVEEMNVTPQQYEQRQTSMQNTFTQASERNAKKVEKVVCPHCGEDFEIM